MRWQRNFAPPGSASRSTRRVYPNRPLRCACNDPEGNPFELWEPAGRETPRVNCRVKRTESLLDGLGPAASAVTSVYLSPAPVLKDHDAVFGLKVAVLSKWS